MNRTLATTVIFSGFFLLGLLLLMWGILLPDLARELAMSNVISGTLFTLFSFGMMLGGILGGKYASRFDFLPLFASLAAINALFILIASFMTHWAGFMVLVFMVGVTSSCKITIGHTIIAQLYVKSRFAMMGVMDFMFSLGTLVASFYVSGIYLWQSDWRLPLQFLALLWVTLALLTAISVRTQRGKGPDLQNTSSAPKQTLAFATIVRQPVFLFLSLASFGYGAVEFGTVNWFVSYAQQGLAFDGDTARLLLAGFTGGMALSRLCFAVFLRWFSVHRLMVVLVTILLIGAFVAKLGADFMPIWLGNFLLGLGLGGLFPLILSAAMNIDSDKGPLLSGITILGNAMGVQLISFGTGAWAGATTITTAYWSVPLAAILLWSATWYYSRLIKGRSA
ncbi:MAG: MFS transporter [Alteromonadaceae bacterium]|nr:MFS transporter [Alteromonadaceae bacterium]